MMKNLALTIIGIILGVVILEAQAPEKFSYQAVVRNASNQLVINQSVGVRISILKGMAMDIEYQETHTAMTNVNGLVSLEVGGGTSTMMGEFSDIDWGDGPYYIQTEIDPLGGIVYSIMGATELISVPYALYAGNVKKYKIGDMAFGGIIFWVEECGHHGLVSDTVDLSTEIEWGGFGTVTNAVRDDRYSGQYNTERIVIGLGAGSYAAQLCANHNGSGYGDWYLPSISELQLMYDNIKGIGNFDGAIYWSSMEASFANAFNFNFTDGSTNNNDKAFTLRVRAIRAF